MSFGSGESEMRQLTEEPAGSVFRRRRNGRERVSGAGEIQAPDPASGVDPRCVSLTAPMSYEAAQYLRLRAALSPLSPDNGGAAIGIYSAAAGDGKSLTAINLAGALAQDGDARVLLIDADLRRRSESLGRYLALANSASVGLGDLLVHPRLRIEEAVVARRGPRNFDLLLVGTVSVAPYEAIVSRRFGDVLMRARSSYTHVIVDAPPIIPVPDCKGLSRWLDGFVMVVAANRTPRPVLAEALRILDPEKLLGLVLNESDQLPHRYHAYYGAYGYATRSDRTRVPQREAVVKHLTPQESMRPQDRFTGGSSG